VSEVHSISLETLAGGALAEMFEHELARVLANIANPNTPSTAAREIVVKVRIKPNENRDIGQITATCFANLPRNLPAVTQAYLGMNEGVLMAVEADPRQPGLFGEPSGKVHHLETRRS
jgi:hypothetical protein